MCNTGRAGGYCKDSAYVSFITPKPLINACLLRIRIIYYPHKLINALSCTQPRRKLLIHKHDRQLAEHIKMYIILGIRRCYKKKECDRLIIKRFKINSSRNDHRRKSRLGHRVTFSVRNGYSFADSCCRLLFSGKNLFFVGFLIGNLSTLNHECDRLLKRLLLVRGCCPKHHASRIK